MCRLGFCVRVCFNTQPPEGGWYEWRCSGFKLEGFNTQPPEGGWGIGSKQSSCYARFNTQPPEGGWLVMEQK